MQNLYPVYRMLFVFHWYFRTKWDSKYVSIEARKTACNLMRSVNATHIGKLANLGASSQEDDTVGKCSVCLVTADHRRLPQTNVHVHRRPKKIAGKRKIDDFHAN